MVRLTELLRANVMAGGMLTHWFTLPVSTSQARTLETADWLVRSTNALACGLYGDEKDGVMLASDRLLDHSAPVNRTS